VKYIYIIGCLLSLVSCGVWKQAEVNAISGPEALRGRVQRGENANQQKSTLAKSVNGTQSNLSTIADVSASMKYLASDKLQGRDSGSKGLAAAADYIEHHLAKNKVRPYFSSFKDTLSNFTIPTFNIVGVVEGTDVKLKREYVIIGAHYDHLGLIKELNGDAIANGANDNASGTTAVLEIARYFGNTHTNKRSIIFALFSAEEKGLLGSSHLAKKLKLAGVDVYTMLNFEMVGVSMEDRKYLLYATGYERSNLGDIMNKYANSNLIGYLPKAKEFNLFSRSDNFPFHNQFKVPSHTFSSFDFTNYAHYHKVSDSYELIDLNHMVNVINTIIPVLEKVVNAESKEIIYN